MIKKYRKNISDILNTYRQFFAYSSQDRFYFNLDLLTVFAAVVTNTVMIWLLGKPLTLIQNQEYDALNTVLFVFVAVVLFNQVMQFVGGYLTKWMMLRFTGRVRNAILSRLLKLSFPVADQFSKGDLLARLSNDVDRVSSVIVQARIMLVSHVLTLSFYITMLFYINVQLALIAMAMTPIFFFHQQYFSPRRRKATEQFLKNNGELLSFEEQSLSNLRGISTNRAESLILHQHLSSFEKARAWLMREQCLDIGFGATFSIFIYIVGVLIVLAGVSSIKDGVIPIGALVSFLLYLGYLSVPVRGIADVIFQTVGNMGAAERVLALINAKETVLEQKNSKTLEVTKGAIVVENMAFSYSDNTPVFNNVNLTIAGGSTIALIGPSGSGKSTFATLLLRFYDPQKGSIKIDGVDLRDLSIASLRNNMAVVWQSPFLASGSVRENLLMANQNSSESQIREACQRSYAWGFIEVLPDKLNTIIGNGGVTLSGGQQQRLAIAQAFLRDAPILILDEASSALDSEAEQVIVKAINELRENRTTLMIAHRYSSIRTADKILYFSHDGSVTLSSHEELLKTKSEYREAVDWQTAGG